MKCGVVPVKIIRFDINRAKQLVEHSQSGLYGVRGALPYEVIVIYISCPIYICGDEAQRDQQTLTLKLGKMSRIVLEP
jgi:hypothetical protein